MEEIFHFLKIKKKWTKKIEEFIHKLKKFYTFKNKNKNGLKKIEDLSINERNLPLFKNLNNKKATQKIEEFIHKLKKSYTFKNKNKNGLKKIEEFIHK